MQTVVIFTYQLLPSSYDNGGLYLSSPRQPPSQLTQRESTHEIALRGAGGSTHKHRSVERNQGGFQHFLGVAQDLAALSPDQTLSQLEQKDPFGTRTFDAALMERETLLRRILTFEEIKEIFPCPRDEERITLPDVRDEKKAREFREGKKGTFLFFQHLRKAGVRIFVTNTDEHDVLHHI